MKSAKVIGAFEVRSANANERRCNFRRAGYVMRSELLRRPQSPRITTLIWTDVMESPAVPYVAEYSAATRTAPSPDASPEPRAFVPLYENSTRTGYGFEFVKRATREVPDCS